jgi:hypothetical protein
VGQLALVAVILGMWQRKVSLFSATENWHLFLCFFAFFFFFFLKSAAVDLGLAEMHVKVIGKRANVLGERTVLLGEQIYWGNSLLGQTSLALAREGRTKCFQSVL